MVRQKNLLWSRKVAFEQLIANKIIREIPLLIQGLLNGRPGIEINLNLAKKKIKTQKH